MQVTTHIGMSIPIGMGALEAGEAQRHGIIVNSSAAYDEERRTKRVFCSRSAWLNDSLREKGLRLLSDCEQSSIERGETPHLIRSNAVRALSSNALRAAVVNKAVAEYRADPSIRRACSCLPYVNQALRDAGQVPLGGDEAKLFA